MDVHPPAEPFVVLIDVAFKLVMLLDLDDLPDKLAVPDHIFQLVIDLLEGPEFLFTVKNPRVVGTNREGWVREPRVFLLGPLFL